MNIRRSASAALAGALLLASLTACSSGNDADGEGTVNWWTWDPVQADAYSQCIPDFEADNPGVKVKITSYNVGDYFTKLTAGFVSGDAPDGFMISPTFLDSYASQNQLLPLDDKIAADSFDMDALGAGVELWKFTDGTQYGIPMDWALGAMFYNKDLVSDAGVSEDEIQNLTWDPETGGTLLTTVRHLTVDENGVRGDEPGFDKNKVKTYGIGSLASESVWGDLAWGPLAGSTGVALADAENWPTQINYADPDVVAALEFAKQIADEGYSPQPKQFTTSGTDQLGTGSVALLADGSWSASTYAKLPGVDVGTAPLAKSESGTRSLPSNINGNVIWAGSEQQDAVWKWVSYQESEACQTRAATYNASFFPSNSASMAALVDHSATTGLDLSVFGAYQADGEIFPMPAFANGAEVESTLRPLIAQYFSGEVGDEVFQKLQDQSKTIITGDN